MSTNASVLNFNRRQAAQSSTDGEPKKDPASIWLNLGYWTEMERHDTGEIDQVFISLPFGIPLDTMTRKGTDRVSGFKLDLAEGANQLLDDVIAMAASIEPGEEKTVGIITEGLLQGMVLTMRRVKVTGQITEERKASFIRRFGVN